MRKLNIVRNGLFVMMAVAALASCEQKQATTETPAAQSSSSSAKANDLKIAYVLIDTLTNQYEYYKVVSDNFQKKQANAEATIAEKGKNFASQVQEFQRKVQANSITQQQYETEQARLQKLQQDIEGLQSRLSNSLQEEYQKELQALTDTIQNFTKKYAEEKGYDFILCKSSGIDNVLYGAPQYDVTNEVVAALNKRYAQEKKKTNDSDAAKK
ncbi:MAG: OmpH family outer membrane protein [Bacteroidaceae bacterium]|nr:OmpH family outer membrane protein [Bacteroidaceae bacterium]